MRKVRILSVLVLLALAMTIPLAMAKPSGYNWKARVFVGTGEEWYMQKHSASHAAAHANLGIYSHDKLVMKWNAEWDRGNDEAWANGPYDAWCTNQWNGMSGDGSGETWHYKNVWVGPDDPDTIGVYDPPYPRDGIPLWGQFEMIMSHGTYGGEHIWEIHATPTGLSRP